MHSFILKLLESYISVSKHTTSTNYSFFCPKCSHRKPKLEIDINTGKWHCWVCDDGGNSFYTLGKWLNWPNEIIFQFPKSKKVSRSFITQQTTTVKLPMDFIPLYENVEHKSMVRKNVERFLFKIRRLRPIDVYKHFIGYCNSGEYSKMVIFPNYSNTGKLNYFTTRAFMGELVQKFKNPHLQKNIIGFDYSINWKMPVIIVEGALDAIAVRINGLPCYGKINKTILSEIIRKKPPMVVIALDADAFGDSLEAAYIFLSYNINTKIVKFDIGEDPSKLGHEKVWQRINNAEIVTKKLLLEYSLKQKFDGKNKPNYSRFRHSLSPISAT